EALQYYSSSIATAATGMGYAQMDFTNALLSEYIRNLGYKAIDCSRNDVALSVPLALQAGLGDLGRNGIVITPQFGPRVRLSKIITDLPLEPDAPTDFGVTEFCTACEKCARMCPSHSIMSGERTDQPRGVSNVGGELKWPINPVTCRMYWAKAKRGGGCTICISCCPYTKPDTLPHRTVRWFTDHARWADSLYVKMDDWLGYGKPKRADNFWEEWQP
ncbi:MAG: reductive dehalogenase, partial [Chloroflexi bacterium]|nr:reductive dehalogenase [Chloroflexota bacterium]